MRNNNYFTKQDFFYFSSSETINYQSPKKLKNFFKKNFSKKKRNKKEFNKENSQPHRNFSTDKVKSKHTFVKSKFYCGLSKRGGRSMITYVAENYGKAGELKINLICKDKTWYNNNEFSILLTDTTLHLCINDNELLHWDMRELVNRSGLTKAEIIQAFHDNKIRITFNRVWNSRGFFKDHGTIFRIYY